MTEEKRIEMIDGLVDRLAEYADAVQIHATWLTPDGCTNTHHTGSGNWNARVGLAHNFLDHAKQSDAAFAIGEVINDE